MRKEIATFRQTTNHIMMIRPAHFGFNPETATNNAFQDSNPTETMESIKQKAIEEFDQMVAALQDKGVSVTVVQDTSDPIKPDAIFPNNWVSFHENGRVITYPMFSPLRRQERQEAIIEELGQVFEVHDRVHMESGEDQDQFLEGTGSMILDRVHRLVYACRSLRTHGDLLDQFAKENQYTPILFDAVDRTGAPIYHTNVMMALGTTLAIICLDSIQNEKERSQVITSLQETGKQIVDISLDQVYAFAGNMLEVQNQDGDPIMVMSAQAYEALTSDQIQLIEAESEIFYADISTIERYGGGSARCMMAEVFLQIKED